MRLYEPSLAQQREEPGISLARALRFIHLEMIRSTRFKNLLGFILLLAFWFGFLII